MLNIYSRKTLQRWFDLRWEFFRRILPAFLGTRVSREFLIGRDVTMRIKSLTQSHYLIFRKQYIFALIGNQENLNNIKETFISVFVQPCFREIYPDFMQSKVWNRRVTLKDELERQDMLERRMNIDIPEFYVGQLIQLTSEVFANFSDLQAPLWQSLHRIVTWVRRITGLLEFVYAEKNAVSFINSHWEIQSKKLVRLMRNI